MEYQVNMGCWGNVFAVPAAVVDHFSKLASETQLKVLLYLLRNTDQGISTARIAEFFRITEEQTEEAVQFWVQANILLMPSEAAQTIAQGFDFTPAPPVQKPAPVPKAKAFVQRNSGEIKLNPSEIAASLEKSPILRDLFTCTETLFGRMLNHMEQRSLLWIHDYLGMSSEVLMILLGYCVSIGKVSVSYAEAIAIRWMEEEILTMQQAEAEIARLTAERTFVSEIRKRFDMRRKPTTSQQEYIDLWQTAGYSLDLIQYAYELTIEKIDKLNFKYINTILEKWALQEIRTLEQAQKTQKAHAAAHASSASAQSASELDEYLSVVNRFRKD